MPLTRQDIEDIRKFMWEIDSLAVSMKVLPKSCGIS